MQLSLGDVTLWFDVSGPSVVPRGNTAVERPTLVAVHGGPGLDHVNLKAELAPLAKHVQIVFYDQRGHGRSDYSTPSFWNLRTWADDLRRLCDALGLVKPVVLVPAAWGATRQPPSPSATSPNRPIWSARSRSPRNSPGGCPLTPLACCACLAHVTPSSVTGPISPSPRSTNSSAASATAGQLPHHRGD